MIAVDWTDPAVLGYPVLFGGVLIGSIVPFIPTGALVGAAAAVAVSTGEMSFPLVLALSAAGALLGDLVTFALARLGSARLVRRLARGQSAQRLASVRERFRRHGDLLIVVGRLVPAGRIPSLLAAAALDHPWRRVVPASTVGCVLWTVVYAALGALSGGLFDSPLLATSVVTVVVLAITAVGALIGRRRMRAARSAA